MEDKLVWIKKIELKRKKYYVYTSEDDKPIPFTEDTIIKNRIMKGASFYPNDWKKIIESIDNELMYDKVLKYIDYQPRTEAEVVNYLNEKKVNSDVILTLIRELKKSQFINDERFAKSYVTSAIRRKMGPLDIRMHLIQKGINENIIDNALEAYEDSEKLDNARNIAVKTIATCKGIPLLKQKECVYNKLLRFGYSYEIIKQATRDLEYKELDLELLKTEYEKLKEKDLDDKTIVAKLAAKGYTYQEINQLVKDY